MTVPPHDLDAARIARALDALAPAGRRVVGTVVRVVERIPSTMDDAASWAAEGAPDGAPDGAVVVANHQTAGRGRLGRTWETPPGAAIALSLVLRPRLEPARVAQVAMAVGLGALEALEAALAPASHAVVDAPARGPRLESEAGASEPPQPGSPRSHPSLGLKWPNDLVAVGECAAVLKLGGLLAEASWRAGDALVVVGLGVNVHQPEGALSAGATSLAALGVAPARRDRSALVAAVLAAVDARYAALLGGEDLVPAWSARLVTLGRDVVVRPVVGAGGGSHGPAMAGRAVGVAADGALRVVDARGVEHVVRAEDVTLAGGGGDG